MRALHRIGHGIQRRFALRDVSILSDDCWGGQYYRILGIPYLTPTVGCWIEPAHYLDFVLAVLSGQELTATKAEDTGKYPILRVGPSRLHFIHDTDAGKALETFARRVQRLNRHALFVKVDFGKYYSAADVQRWNQLALPNAVALYPRGTPVTEGIRVHHGLAIDGWDIDGAKMYGISQRFFNVGRWLKTGRIERGPLYSAFERTFLRSN